MALDKKDSIKKKKVITPKFRVSFPQVFKPKAFEDQEAKFSVVMLFDGKTDLKAMQKAADYAAIEKWGPKDSWSPKLKKKLKSPFRDGDEREDTEGYKGKTFVTATSKLKPQVIDLEHEPITEESGGFYAGCYAQASVIAFAYDTKGNCGVSFSLQNLIKVADGKPFSGRKDAKDDFKDLEVDEEEEEETEEDDDDGGF